MATTVATTASSSWDALHGVIRRIRNRWRARLALHGLAVVAFGVLLAVLFGAWAMQLFRFSPASVGAVRVVAYAVVAGLVARYLVGPLRRRANDNQVALYFEEHRPGLDAVVLSAVEARSRDLPAYVRSPQLAGRVVDTAAARAAAAGSGAGIETRRVTASLLTLAGTLLVGAIAIGFGPEFFRTGARLLVSPRTNVKRHVYIAVQPGNAAVGRGGDLAIRAQLHGVEATGATLVLRHANGTVERIPMTLSRDSGAFMIRLFDIKEPATYRVEGSGLRSPEYRITVVAMPAVQQLSLEYHYPAYTGLPTLKVPNGGDIAAPVGTSVIVRVTTTMPVQGARLVIEGRPPIPMTVGPDGALTGTIPVTAPGFYKVELDTPGGSRAGSLDYTIDVLEDHDPTINFIKPGRDVSVRADESVLTQVEATDDYGVATVELRYSVNGGPEQAAVLTSDRSKKEVVAGYTFPIDKLGLKPGDLVSYYALAKDNDGVHGGKTVKTDIYFVNVKPPRGPKPDMDDQNGGGGGDQNNGPSPGELVRKQREIMAGTFKVDRDRTRMTAKTVTENTATLSSSQARLRDQVGQLNQQIVQRGLARSNPLFATIAEELPKAVEEMKSVEAALAAPNLHDALSPEQRALQHLQRADAAFRMMKKKMSRNPQQSRQMDQDQDDDDLANLFDAKKKQLNNQYETDQRKMQKSPSTEAVDELARKLKELAERQQRASEERKQQQQMQDQQGGMQQSGQQSGQQMDQQQSNDGGESQRRMADQMDRAARELQQLSRDFPNDRALREAARKLAEAADAMRRAAASPDPRDAAKALEKLNEARRMLEQHKQDGQNGNGDQQMLDRARDLVRSASALSDRMRQMQGEQQKGQQMAGQQKGQQQKGQQPGDQQGMQPDGSQPGEQQAQQPGEGQVGKSRGSKFYGYAPARGGQPQSGGSSDGMPSKQGMSSASPEEWAQLEQQLGEQREAADALRRDLKRAGQDTKDLDRTLAQMRALEGEGAKGQLPSAVQLQGAVAEHLKEWEYALRQKIDPDRTARPALGMSDDVPADFKAQVDEYYRSLAKKP